MQPCETFTTHLVGIAGMLPGADVVDTGIGFDWSTTWNGTTGGISVLNSSLPPDPGSGTGGITVLNFNGTTTYQFPKSFGVSGVNGNTTTPPTSASTLLPPEQVSVVASGLVYSRLSQTFNGTVTITNVSNTTIAGPFQLVFNSLTPGVTVANPSGSFGGWSFLTVPATGTLAPGEAATLNVQFKNALNAPIAFTAIPYSGSFN